MSSPQFVVAVGYHYTMASTANPERTRDHFRTALHHAVTDWLRGPAKTRYPLAARTADLVVRERTRDPEVTVVYLTANDLLAARERTIAKTSEYVKVS